MKAPEHEGLASHTQDSTGAAADSASRTQPYLNGGASDLARPDQSFTSQDSAGSPQGHHATPLLNGQQGTSEGAREEPPVGKTAAKRRFFTLGRSKRKDIDRGDLDKPEGGTQDQARSKSTGRALRPTSKSNEDARRSKKGRQRGREASDTRSDGEEGGGGKPGAGARSWWAWPAAAPARPVATVDGSGASSLSSGSKLSDGGQAAASIRALKVAAPPSSAGPVAGNVSSPQAAQGCMGLGLFGMSSAPKVAMLKPALMATSATGADGRGVGGSPPSLHGDSVHQPGKLDTSGSYTSAASEEPSSAMQRSPTGRMAEDRGAPDGGSFSRRVSWDGPEQSQPSSSNQAGTLPEATAVRAPSPASPFMLRADRDFSESESEQPASSRSLSGNSRSLAGTLSGHVPAAASVTAQPGTIQLPSDAARQQPQRAPAPDELGTGEVQPGASAEPEASGGKKGHRRGKSLTNLMTSLGKRQPRRSVSQLMDPKKEEKEPSPDSLQDGEAASGVKTPKGHATSDLGTARGPHSRPKTPDVSKAGQSSALACFGLGSGTTLDDRHPSEPKGIVGLQNVGNTCFANAALQCIRFTPGLAELLGPDLAALSAAAAGPLLPGAIDCEELLERISGIPAGGRQTGVAASTPAEEAPTAAEAPAPQEAALEASGLEAEQQRLRTIASEGADLAHLSSLSPPAAHSTGAAGLLHRQMGEAGSGGAAVASIPEDAGSRSPAVDGLQEEPVESGLRAHQLAGTSTPSTIEPMSLPPSGLATPVSEQHAPVPGVLEQAVANVTPSLGGLATAADAQGSSHALPVGPGQAAETAAQQGRHSSEHQQPQAEQAADDQGPGAGPPAGAADGAEATAAAVAPAEQQEPPPPPLAKGEMASAFREFFRQVLSSSEAVDPSPLWRRVAQLPLGREMSDGGQHDCQEMLRLLMDSLHDDLNRIKQKPPYVEEKTDASEAEAAKAARMWDKYLGVDNSPITDLFCGQLQSTVHCHKCGRRFTMYEPFWDLSLPLTREGKGGLGAWLSGKATPASIMDCMQGFFGDEKLEGDEAFSCEVCRQRTDATKHMRIHRLPLVLMLHIKRFKFAGQTREKLTSNVTYPLKGLKLAQFASEECAPNVASTSYDLYAVSNHIGSLVGGHYTAHCLTRTPQSTEQWYAFDDQQVEKVNPQAVVNPCAYILFYCSSALLHQGGERTPSAKP